MTKLNRDIYQNYLNTLYRLPQMTNEDFRSLRKEAKARARQVLCADFDSNHFKD